MGKSLHRSCGALFSQTICKSTLLNHSNIISPYHIYLLYSHLQLKAKKEINDGIVLH